MHADKARKAVAQRALRVGVGSRDEDFETIGEDERAESGVDVLSGLGDAAVGNTGAAVAGAASVYVLVTLERLSAA